MLHDKTGMQKYQNTGKMIPIVYLLEGNHQMDGKIQTVRCEYPKSSFVQNLL